MSLPYKRQIEVVILISKQKLGAISFQALNKDFRATNLEPEGAYF